MCFILHNVEDCEESPSSYTVHMNATFLSFNTDGSAGVHNEPPSHQRLSDLRRRVYKHGTTTISNKAKPFKEVGRFLHVFSRAFPVTV